MTGSDVILGRLVRKSLNNAITYETWTKFGTYETWTK